ncbi:hypothetical protein BH20ACT2_BH20ACT2_12810 [soil metagenome]
MPKVDPDTGQPMDDDPEQDDEDLAGGEGSALDPDREKGDEGPYEQGASGH